MPPGYDGMLEADQTAGDGTTGVLDLFDILDAMTAHTHEHYHELVRMPWKVFAVKWVRLIEFARRERAKKRERELEQGWQELERVHKGQ